MIQIGKYIEMAIQWLTENFAPFFDAVNSGIGGGIDVFNQALLWIPFYLFIILFTVLASSPLNTVVTNDTSLK